MTPEAVRALAEKLPTHAARLAERASAAYDARATRTELLPELLPTAGGRRVIYMNRRVRRYFRRQIREGVSAGGGITYENINGKRVAS